MAKTLKSQGRVELSQLLQRARRQYAMGRIAKPDLDYIEKRLLEVDLRIRQMHEVDERGREVSGSDNAAQDSGDQVRGQHHPPD